MESKWHGYRNFFAKSLLNIVYFISPVLLVYVLLPPIFYRAQSCCHYFSCWRNTKWWGPKRNTEWSLHCSRSWLFKYVLVIIFMQSYWFPTDVFFLENYVDTKDKQFRVDKNVLRILWALLQRANDFLSFSKLNPGTISQYYFEIFYLP